MRTGMVTAVTVRLHQRLYTVRMPESLSHIVCRGPSLFQRLSGENNTESTSGASRTLYPSARQSLLLCTQTSSHLKSPYTEIEEQGFVKA